MCEQFHVVPWFNTEEWLKAYNEIYSENSNKQYALNLLQMWKARCPSLPSGIESTLSLLQVHVQDEKCNNNIVDEQVLRLAYSSALMRFVNHMLDTDTAKGTSLYIAAKNAGVPDWIVELRHDTAHSNNLPSIELLRNACIISLQWLQNNYWDQYKECIQDYASGQKDVYNIDADKIVAMMHFCSNLSICAHSKIKNLGDIPDPSLQESIVNDAQDLFGDLIDFSKLKTISVASLINLLDTHGKKLLKSKNASLFINKALLGDESLFLSLDLLEYLSKDDFNKKHKLSSSYVQCFEVLLSFLHANNLITEFVLALVEMTHSDDSQKKAMLAALWISEILGALKKSKQFVERANKMDSTGGTSNKKKDLKVLYHHWFPNEQLNRLVLDLQKPVPSKLTDINFIMPIISSYNSYLTYFVKDLLNLMDPQLPKHACIKICKLARVISAPDKFPKHLSQDKIYTVEDLKSDETLTDDVSGEPSKREVSQFFTLHNHSSGIWKIASKLNWGSSPIGTIPMEQSNMDIDMP